MKSIISILFFIFNFITIYSQNKYINGLIVASDSILVSYATIYSETLKIGCISDSFGRFVLPDPGVAQRISVKYVGYKPKTVTYSNSFGEIFIIKIDPDTIQIKELIVRPLNKKIGSIDYVPSEKIKGYIISCSGYNYQCGICIHNKDKINGRVDKIYFMLKNPNLDRATFRVRIYTIDDKLSPKNDILSKNLIISIPKLKKFKFIEVDLSEYGVIFSGEGMLVTLEWLLVPENKYDYNYNNVRKKKYAVRCFAPILALTENQDTNTFEMYSKRDDGVWHRGGLTSSAMLHKNSFVETVPLIKIKISKYE